MNELQQWLEVDKKVRVVVKGNVRWEGPWNDAKDDAETYCGDCDYSLDEGAEDWNYCPMCGLKLVYGDEFIYGALEKTLEENEEQIIQKLGYGGEKEQLIEDLGYGGEVLLKRWVKLQKNGKEARNGK